ncbi:MAG: DUF3108 domain-containing protein [Burkholderiaceae bacterium]
MNQRLLRRRVGLVALALLVALGHWLVMELLPELRLGDGSSERMPKRIEVAYVRELAPAAPPAAAPVVVAKRKPAARKAAPPPPAEAASAAEPAVEPAAPPVDVAAAEPVPPVPEPPASAASQPEVPAAQAVAAAASAASAPVAFEWPPSTQLSYRLRGNYRGEVVGGAQVEWVRAGSRYQVHLDVWVGAQAAPLVGRRMSSDGELGDHGLTPRRYDEETRALFRELRRRTIVFDGERVLMPNSKQLARVPGLQDAASQFVQMTWLFTTQPQLLTVGNRIEVPLALPNNIDMWAYDVIGKESLDTPFGPIETFHLRPKRERPSKLELVADAWFAPSLQYLPIRLLIRQDEATYVDMMIERLPLQAAPASAPK